MSVFISTCSRVPHQTDNSVLCVQGLQIDDVLSTWALTMVMVACAWLWAGYLVFSVTPKHTCVAVTGLHATAFILDHFILNFSFTEKRDGSEAALAAPKRVAEDHLT